MKAIFTDPTKQKRLGIAAVVLTLGLGGYALYSNITHQPQAQKIIPIVRTYTVGQAADAAATAKFYPGEVRGRYESQLAFQVAGKIAARYVNVGDTVRAGQVLLALDPKDVAQSVEATTAQLASARASYKLAADNAARYSSLYAQGAVSEAVRDQYMTQLEAASAALRQAQAQANVSSNQLGYTQLLSDADGTITAINAEIGQVVAAGTPIAVLVSKNEREIQINIPEGTPIKVNQKAKITFWALPNESTEGFVREIASMADSVTRTYKVCIAVPNLPQNAKLGMTAKVELFPNEKGNNKDNTFLLPAQALYQVNQKTQVWIVEENKAKLVDVAVDGYSGNEIIISQGIKAGDKVITAGLAKLTPNQEVRLEEGGDK